LISLNTHHAKLDCLRFFLTFAIVCTIIRPKLNKTSTKNYSPVRSLLNKIEKSQYQLHYKAIFIFSNLDIKWFCSPFFQEFVIFLIDKVCFLLTFLRWRNNIAEIDVLEAFILSNLVVCENDSKLHTECVTDLD